MIYIREYNTYLDHLFFVPYFIFMVNYISEIQLPKPKTTVGEVVVEEDGRLEESPIHTYNELPGNSIEDHQAPSPHQGQPIPTKPPPSRPRNSNPMSYTPTRPGLDLGGTASSPGQNVFLLIASLIFFYHVLAWV